MRALKKKIEVLESRVSDLEKKQKSYEIYTKNDLLMHKKIEEELNALPQKLKAMLFENSQNE